MIFCRSHIFIWTKRLLYCCDRLLFCDIFFRNHIKKTCTVHFKRASLSIKIIKGLIWQVKVKVVPWPFFQVVREWDFIFLEASFMWRRCPSLSLSCCLTFPTLFGTSYPFLPAESMGESEPLHKYLADMHLSSDRRQRSNYSTNHSCLELLYGCSKKKSTKLHQ